MTNAKSGRYFLADSIAMPLSLSKRQPADCQCSASSCFDQSVFITFPKCESASNRARQSADDTESSHSALRTDPHGEPSASHSQTTNTGADAPGAEGALDFNPFAGQANIRQKTEAGYVDFQKQPFCEDGFSAAIQQRQNAFSYCLNDYYRPRSITAKEKPVYVCSKPTPEGDQFRHRQTTKCTSASAIFAVIDTKRRRSGAK